MKSSRDHKKLEKEQSVHGEGRTNAKALKQERQGMSREEGAKNSFTK